MSHPAFTPRSVHAAGQVVYLFRDWAAARAHIRDHLLTAPEAYAWGRLAQPLFGELVVSDDFRQRARCADALFAGSHADAPGAALYDLYADAITTGLNSAEWLGWRAQRGKRLAWLAHSGLLIYATHEQTRWIVTTAYLPGQGVPYHGPSQADDDPRLLREATSAQPARDAKPHPKREGMRGPRRDAPHAQTSARPHDAYLIFKQALAAVREKRARASSRSEHPAVIAQHAQLDDALIQAVLPNGGATLKRDHWTKLASHGEETGA